MTHAAREGGFGPSKLGRDGHEEDIYIYLAEETGFSVRLMEAGT